MTRGKPMYKQPGMKKGERAAVHELEVVNGETGERKPTGKRVIVDDRTEGSEWMAAAKVRVTDLRTQIEKCNARIGAGMYEIGTALKLVRDDKLWQADGAKSFVAWIEIHCAFSRVTAHNMITVAETLSREEAERYGPSLSYAIAKATDEDVRKELQAMAANGVSPAEIKRERIRMLREKTAKDPGSVPARKGAREPKKVIERAVSVSGSNGIEKFAAPIEKVRGKKVEPARSGLTGVFDLKAVDPKNKGEKERVKEGWTLAAERVQIGEDGPVIRLEVNVEKSLVKYRIV